MEYPDIIKFEKVDSPPPSRQNSRYRRLHDELVKMPGQWVRIEKPFKSGSDASGAVSHLKKNYKLDASARSADGKVYHVYVRYVQQET